MGSILDALDFPVAKVDLYDSEHSKVNGYQAIKRLDTNDVLAIVTPLYKLVPHVEAFAPVLAVLGEEWEVTQVKVETNGARAYVKAVNPKYAVNVGGHEIIPQLVIPNSYNRTMKLRADVGFFRIICSNGLKVPLEGFPQLNFKTRHWGEVGQRQAEWLKQIHLFTEQVPELVKTYSALTDKIVPEEKAKDILLEILGEKKLEKVLWYWLNGKGQDGRPTAWALYNGVTEYLSNDWSGAEHLSSETNMRVLNTLLKLS